MLLSRTKGHWVPWNLAWNMDHSVFLKEDSAQKFLRVRADIFYIFVVLLVDSMFLSTPKVRTIPYVSPKKHSMYYFTYENVLYFHVLHEQPYSGNPAQVSNHLLWQDTESNILLIRLN